VIGVCQVFLAAKMDKAAVCDQSHGVPQFTGKKQNVSGHCLM
jgi:hypothetical protein